MPVHVEVWGWDFYVVTYGYTNQDSTWLYDRFYQANIKQDSLSIFLTKVFPLFPYTAYIEFQIRISL